MPTAAAATSLSRQTFQRELSNKSIDVKRAAADKRLEDIDVEGADLDGDGVIKGAQETAALFKAVDDLDRDGRSGSVKLGTRSGARTVAPRLLALAEHARADGLAKQVKKGIAAAKAIEAAPDPALTKGVADAAKKLVDDRAADFGVPNKWVNSDPTHAAPTGRPIHGTEDRWKCNLFAGNALAAAGFQAPKYNNADPAKGERGEYPNANQWHKFSDAYAPGLGNKTHFKLVGEMNPLDYPEGPARDKAVAAFLAKHARPGDIVTVDHIGPDTADGGHVRVVVGNTLKPDGTGALIAAQARQDKAHIEHDTAAELGDEERIWVLRPVLKAPAPTQTPTDARS